MNDDAALIDRFITVIEQDILPKTRAGVAAGNKVFGAAILRKSDRSVVIAETNNETENPLWHGEMHALKRFYELPADQRPATRDCLFLSTHEPCSLCLSAITWAGFDNFWYLFSHEDSRDEFAIPHDLEILKEVFRLEPGGYNHRNAFWTAHGLRAEINRLPADTREAFHTRLDAIKTAYAGLSETYQASKDGNDIPLN
ncbi:MAG: nucleoside deaminase [Proteobacteria bacterium]|nr:nucleoside deaminase [Pseudomonadota bacterium]